MTFLKLKLFSGTAGNGGSPNGGPGGAGGNAIAGTGNCAGGIGGIGGAGYAGGNNILKKNIPVIVWITTSFIQRKPIIFCSNKMSFFFLNKNQQIWLTSFFIMMFYKIVLTN